MTATTPPPRDGSNRIDKHPVAEHPSGDLTATELYRTTTTDMDSASDSGTDLPVPTIAALEAHAETAERPKGHR